MDVYHHHDMGASSQSLTCVCVCVCVCVWVLSALSAPLIFIFPVLTVHHLVSTTKVIWGMTMTNYTWALQSWETTMVKELSPPLKHTPLFPRKYLTVKSHPSPHNLGSWMSSCFSVTKPDTDPSNSHFLPHKLLADLFRPHKSIGTKCLLSKLCFSVSPFLRSLNFTQPQLGLAYVCAMSLQLCPTVYDPMGCSPPGSYIHRILQARILASVHSSSLKVHSRNRLTQAKHSIVRSCCCSPCSSLFPIILKMMDLVDSWHLS